VRIVIVHNSYRQRGGEDTVFEQERELLRSAGHDVAVYHRTNAEIDGFSAPQRALLPLRTIWADDACAEFVQLLRSHRPDLVHVHNTFVLISPAIYGACRQFGIPIVTTLHNYRLLCPAATFFRNGGVCEECVQHGLLRSVQHGCYRNSRLATATVAATLAYHRSRNTWADSDCLIALTQFARDKFASSGIPADKLVIKPNFVYPDPGPGDEVRNGPLFVGRLTEEKGVRTLLAAWELLPRDVPLTIIGDGPLKGELMARARNVHLDKIHFTGALAREQVLQAMKRASFLIFPSEWYESFAMTILEAYACRTPVIASNLGVMPEVVHQGATGVLFEPANPRALAECVRATVWDAETVRDMGQRARRTYLANYTASRNLEILIGIYERCIRARSASTQGVSSAAA
jgi:glycosyltransferase involved in cell wall biosynthesis